MALFDERFEGWQAADFDAFAERKWASNRFNLERGRVRSRLLDLLGQVRSKTALHDDGLAIWTSPDHPKLNNGHRVRWQAAAYCRTEPLRRAIERTDPALDADDVRHSHVHLGVVIELDVLRVLLMLPRAASLDRSRWSEAEAVWRQLAEASGVQLQEDERGARVERSFTRDEVLQGGAESDELGRWLAGAMAALHAALWLPEHDPDGVGGAVLAAMEAAVAPRPGAPASRPSKSMKLAPAGSKTAELQSVSLRTASRAARPGELRVAALPPRPPKPPPRPPGRYRPARPPPSSAPKTAPKSASSSLSKSAPKPPPRPPPKPHANREQRRDARPRRDHRPAGPRGPYRLGPSEPAGKKAGAIAVGARVVLRSGLFAGKEGEIVSLSKGVAEVAVGVMKVRVPTRDLALS